MLSQEYLPGRMGMAAGLSIGLSIGLGGIAAICVGALADTFGLSAALWTTPIGALVGALLVLLLPSDDLREISVHAVRFTIDGGDARIGRLDGDTVTDAGAAGPQGFVPTDEAWQQLASASGATHPLDSVRLLAPVLPRQILAIGLNYRAHAIESELAIPEVPVVFAMYPSSITGPHDEIVIPREETRTDYEGEVAVVIGEARLPRLAGGRLVVRRRSHGARRCLRPPGAARDAAAPVHARQELRHVHADRARAWRGRPASTRRTSR